MNELPKECPGCGAPVIGRHRPVYDDELKNATDPLGYRHFEPGEWHTVCERGHVVHPTKGTGTVAPITVRRGEQPVVHFDAIPWTY